MKKFFNFRFRRNPSCLKIVFFANELAQKPIKYWANVGRIPKYSKLSRLEKLIKGQLDIQWSNSTVHLTTGSGRLLFPYHVQWMGDRFEFELFSVFGDGRPRLYFTRTVSSNNERFTADEIKEIEKFMTTQHNLIKSSYLMIS